MSRTRAATRHLPKDSDFRLREQQRLAMIGCLTAGLGHDIRNAVMPALLRADTLSASPDLSAAARRDLEGIRSSILGLQHLATGLRLLSQDGRRDSHSTHLASWWKDAAPLVSASLSAGTRLDVHIADDLPETRVPPNLILQSTLALTMNARLWMQGAVAPCVSIRAHALPECVYLTVQYSGEPTEFKRWPPDEALELPEETPVESLSGLGLHRVRELLGEYGADLQLNEMGADSGSFTIELPIQERESGNTQTGTAPVRLDLADPRQLAVARMILAQRGLREWSADDLESPPPALIVCDRASLAAARERVAQAGSGADAPRLIVVGVPETVAEQHTATWVSPSRLGTLADALP